MNGEVRAIRAEVLWDPTLPPNARLLYAMIGARESAGGCDLTYEAIAATIPADRRTIARYVRALVERGLIEHSGWQGRKPSHYRLLPVVVVPEQLQELAGQPADNLVVVAEQLQQPGSRASDNGVVVVEQLQARVSSVVVTPEQLQRASGSSRTTTTTESNRIDSLISNRSESVRSDRSDSIDARLVISSLIKPVADELGDSQPLDVTVRRVLKVFKESGQELADFCDRITDSRKSTIADMETADITNPFGLFIHKVEFGNAPASHHKGKGKKVPPGEKDYLGSYRDRVQSQEGRAQSA